jgi:hypothetical protein
MAKAGMTKEIAAPPENMGTPSVNKSYVLPRDNRLKEQSRAMTCGTGRLVVAIIAFISMTPALAQEKTSSTAPTVSAKKDGRAYIDAHATEWLRDSDVPSMAMAYIRDGKVAWTAVYGEQSPGLAATGICYIEERLEKDRRFANAAMILHGPYTVSAADSGGCGQTAGASV